MSATADIVEAFGAKLVAALERSGSTSADALRRAAYRVIEGAVDLPKLVGEAREALAAEQRRKAEVWENSAARRRARVERIPEWQLVVQTADPSAVRKMLADRENLPKGERWSIGDIAAATNTSRRYVAAVRDLERARADRAWLKKNARNRAMERLQRILARKAYGDPTRERLKQAGGEKPVESKVAADVKNHRFLWAVDTISKMLSSEEYAAAAAFRDAYEGLGGRAKVANWSSSGGGNPAMKLALTPRQERAAREFQVFWRGLGKNPTARAIAINFVLGEKVAGHDRPLSFVEWGKRYANIEGEQQARGIAQGLLWLVCADLAAISREHAHYLAQEQRAVLKAVGRHKEITDMIRRHQPEEAVEALCRLLPVKSWIVVKAVQKLYRAALREQQAAIESRHKEASAA